MPQVLGSGVSHRVTADPMTIAQDRLKNLAFGQAIVVCGNWRDFHGLDFYSRYRAVFWAYLLRHADGCLVFGIRIFYLFAVTTSIQRNL